MNDLRTAGRHRMLVALFLLSSVGLQAQVQPPETAQPSVVNEVERMRLVYLSETGNTRRQCDTADALLLTQYGEAIARFTREAQGRGEFELWQAGTRECERFEKTHAIGPADLAGTPETLRALQERAIQTRTELRKKCAKDIVDLTERMVLRLEAMKRDLTIKGDAAGARQAMDGIDRARSAQVYTDAIFVLDGGVAPAAPPVAAPVADVPSATPAAVPVTGRTGKLTIPDSARIRVLEPGRMPAQNVGMFRLCQLVPTAASTQAGAKVVATARYVAHPQVTLQFSDDQKLTSDAVEFQVSVRTLPGVDTLGPMVVVVEYTGRRTGGVPESVNYTAANVRSLDNRAVSIEMPTTSYQIRIVPSAFGGVRRQRDAALQFGGVVVSVFDAVGTLLYQGVSDRALLPLAGDASRYNADGTLNPAPPQ